MDLGEFVKESLIQVYSGMKNSNDEIIKQFPKLQGHRVFTLSASGRGLKGSGVEFDVAVALKSEDKTGGGGGLKLVVVEAGVGKTQQSSHESMSRIKFSIDVNWTID